MAIASVCVCALQPALKLTGKDLASYGHATLIDLFVSEVLS